MKKIIALLALSAAAWAPLAHAQATCEAQAADKHLAGAAKNSFVKKCVADGRGGSASPAASACDAKAAEKKLAGAAKNSFVKKCVKDGGPK